MTKKDHIDFKKPLLEYKKGESSNKKNGDNKSAVAGEVIGDLQNSSHLDVQKRATTLEAYDDTTKICKIYICIMKQSSRSS